MNNPTKQFTKSIEILIKNKMISSKGELANSLNLKQSTLSEILSERSKVSVETLQLFCKLYQINLDWLFYEEGEMFKFPPPTPNTWEEISPQKEITQLKSQMQQIQETLHRLEMQGFTV